MYAILIPALAMLQPGDDVLTWPIIVAVMGLLGVSVVASAVTALLLRMSAVGVKPESVVYIVCAVLVVVGWVAGGGEVPGIDAADPVGTVAAWTVMAGALGRLTQTLYDVLLRKVWPAPAPA